MIASAVVFAVCPERRFVRAPLSLAPFDPRDQFAGGRQGGFVRAGGEDSNARIFGICRAGIGLMPVRHFNTWQWLIPKCSPMTRADTRVADIAALNSAGVMALR